jgi:YfiH family protein
MTDYDEAILDSNAISPIDKSGLPIPVTIPVALAPGIKVVYTTRLGGSSTGDFGNCNLGGKSGDDPAHVLANRDALCREIGSPISLVSQVHSGVAVDIDDAVHKSNASFGFDSSGTAGGIAGGTADNTAGVSAGDTAAAVIEADGQVTARANIALGMFAADCLPVLMADPIAGVIGAAHCGRRGLERGVIGATVDLMCAKGADPEHIVATLGPCICADCYETGETIADAFDARFPGTFTLTRFGGPGIDIAAAALQELESAGVPRDSVISSRARVNAATQYLSEDEELRALCGSDGEGDADLAKRIGGVRRSLCTLENPLWYSHRRAALAGKAHEGRMLALIVRE